MWHARFRMDAEMVRDYALAASGLLVQRVGGPSVKPYQPVGVWETVAMEGSNTRFYKPDSGRISLEGRDITKKRPSEIAALGVARTFQKTSVFAGQTAHDNVAIGLHLRSKQRPLAILAGLPSVAREEAELKTSLMKDMFRLIDLERELGLGSRVDFTPVPVTIAHPAAVVLALLMLRAHKVGSIARAVATVFQPASEHGKRGMDELHEQTVNLLSFQQLPKAVFDGQVAFNLIDRYGEKSLPSLNSAESRIPQHFHRLVGDRLAVPSLMLLQAPIFHGHAFSLYLELEQAAQTEELTAALSGDHVELLQSADESPSNVNAAGQEQIQVFARRDSQQPNGFWLWAASDNLRIAALTAVECAESMIAARPRGTVQ